MEAEENPKGLPVIGFEHAVHLLENSSPKHSAQYGLSSREVNLQKRRHFDLGCHLKVRFLQFKPSCFFTGLIYMKDSTITVKCQRQPNYMPRDPTVPSKVVDGLGRGCDLSHFPKCLFRSS